MRFFSAVYLAATAYVCAQDVGITSSVYNSQYVFTAENKWTGTTADRIAVYGTSSVAPNWGIGVHGFGGYIGVLGWAQMVGTGNRYGAQFDGSGGTGTNYGVYASASGGSAAWAGYFVGNVFVSGTITQSSDLALKKNVADITSPLAKLGKLRPKSYDLNLEEGKDLKLPSGKKYGFIAQDLEAVYPELVKDVDVAYSSNQKNSPPKTYKAVDYIGLIPVLVGSIQAQQAQIDSLKLIVQALKK